MSKPLVGLLIAALVAVIGWLIWCTQQPCVHKVEGFDMLRWPPDTLRMVRLEGHTYNVTSVPIAVDPPMSYHIWPPDTSDCYPQEMVLVWPPDTTD